MSAREPADTETTAVRATVHGGVQGIGYRDATVRRARRLGAIGWVRNEGDGNVLVHAEGPRPAVEELVAFLREGPRAARVDEVEVESVDVEGHEQFAVRGVSAGVFVVSHNEFEGKTEEGGAVIVWDRGGYEQGGRVPWPEALERGHAVFVLHGRKLRGGFALQRTRAGEKPQWLLIKRRDDEARPGSDIVAEQPRSAIGDRTLDELLAGE